MKEFHNPRTVKELRAFLGLIEFQCKFRKDCSVVMKPLSVWSDKNRGIAIENGQRE